MKQYLDMVQDIVDNGSWVFNHRTGVACLTKLNYTLTYTSDKFPLVTTRKSYWKIAIKEMLCYMRGYSSNKDFNALGVHTWDKNLNNPYWVSNPNKRSMDDLGLIYGASAEQVGLSYKDVINNIIKYPNDRGHIWNFWNPEYFDNGCLRPCMYSHQFTVLNDTLYLTSTQRSCDVLLGGNMNMIQAWFLLAVTAKLTGYKMGTVTHHIVNAHIYSNQYPLVGEQLTRIPYPSPKFIFKQELTYDSIFRDISSGNFMDYFGVLDYQHYDPIKYPFTV